MLAQKLGAPVKGSLVELLLQVEFVIHQLFDWALNLGNGIFLSLELSVNDIKSLLQPVEVLLVNGHLSLNFWKHNVVSLLAFVQGIFNILLFFQIFQRFSLLKVEQTILENE